jgi:hypothetical protein
MSRKKKPRPGYQIPPADDLKNIPMTRHFPDGVRPVEAYEVLEWCPPGTIMPTQVHLCQHVPGLGVLATRIKSPEECDRLIGSLLRHRRSVWPDVEERFDEPAIPR